MKSNKLQVAKRELEALLIPVVLLLTGLFLLGGDRAGVLSLDRIQNLWPVALILVGLSDLLTESGNKTTDGESARERARIGR